MTLRIVGSSRRGSVAGSVPAERIAASSVGVASVPSGARTVGLPPASLAASAAKSASPPTDSTRVPAGDTASSMVRLPMQTRLGAVSVIGRRRGIAAEAEVVTDQLGGEQVQQGRQRLRNRRQGDDVTREVVERVLALGGDD